MVDSLLTAYCVRCKTTRPMNDATPIFFANGRPATRGVCPECATALTRIGVTPAHEGLPKPEVTSTPKAKAKPAKAAVKTGASAKSGAASKAAAPPKGAARKATGSKAKTPAAPARRASAAAHIRHGAKLVIVESPAKARTVGRFLGRDYDVRASIGHVRDLLRSQLSVDVDADFLPKYRVPDDKKELVKTLKAAAAEASEIYLATDPDREGEAIAWHLMEAAAIPPERAQRVVFHEITRSAIADAFSHSRQIDMQLVDAQQARRILDRLVGYQVSPLLWDRVKSRLSAGRVQSVALRLIVEREREILAFVPVEYWSLDAELAQQTTRAEKPRPGFLARLVRIGGQEADLKNREDSLAVVADLEGAAYNVASIKRGERRRRPNPPFTTSTMQQDAASKLGMTAARTMRVAQDLYEGIDTGEGGGPVGLITYMRTDSVNVAAEAQAEARALITQRFGPEYLPETPNIYKARAKNAQEAHEAIRPTSVHRLPAAVREHLSAEQFRLYELIWQRFVASQMAAAVYDTLTVDVEAGAPSNEHPERSAAESKDERPYLFRTTGSSIRFPGYLAVYSGGATGPQENGNGKPNGVKAATNGDGGDAASAELPSAANIPPGLTVGEWLDLLRLLPEQHFTQPPPRYTEASLVKALEEYGIGRPSTYAAIISTILERGYVERTDKKLVPADLGFTVNDLLVKHFDQVFNVGFTAGMEEQLDSISRGEEQMIPVLRQFYATFAPQLKAAEASMEKVTFEAEKTGELCPECSGELIIKQGRFGRFVGCSNYPTCRYTKPLMAKLGVRCPKDGGELVERRTRAGRVFYGCANYPGCDFTSWKRPVAQPCPNCDGLMVVAGRDTAECTVCGAKMKV